MPTGNTHTHTHTHIHNVTAMHRILLSVLLKTIAWEITFLIALRNCFKEV